MADHVQQDLQELLNTIRALTDEEVDLFLTRFGKDTASGRAEKEEILLHELAETYTRFVKFCPPPFSTPLQNSVRGSHDNLLHET